MRSGLIVSGSVHALLLTWGLWSLSAPKALDATYAEALPVEVVMSDAFEGVKGDKKAPVKDKPAPTPTTKPQTLPMEAQNVGDNEVDLDTPPIPNQKPTKAEPTPQPKQADVPPPTPQKRPETKVAEAKPTEPKPEPTPPEPKVEPKPPEPTPEPEKAEPAPEPDPVTEAIKKAELQPEKKPEPPKKAPTPEKKPTPPRTEAKPEKKPEPKKVADAASSNSKEKPTKADGKAQKQEKSEFNADDIAALLSQQKASGGGAKRSTEQASLGSQKTTGTKLSRSEIGELQGMIQEQMAKCWSPPTGLEDAGSLRVSIKVHFDPSGELQGLPEIVQGGGGSGAERIAAEAAMRAIRRCAPFNLPAEKYAGGWDVTTLNFDPSQMF